MLVHFLSTFTFIAQISALNEHVNRQAWQVNSQDEAIIGDIEHIGAGSLPCSWRFRQLFSAFTRIVFTEAFVKCEREKEKRERKERETREKKERKKEREKREKREREKREKRERTEREQRENRERTQREHRERKQRERQR